MRIFKALYLVPLQIELSRAIITDLRRSRRFIDALTTEEDRLLQLLDTVILEHLTLPDMLGVEQLERLARVDNLVVYGDKVGYRLSAVALINAIELFVMRICDFSGILAYLYFRNDCTVVALDSRELVNAAENGRVLRCDKALADTERVDARPLLNGITDNVLIERV